MRRVVRSRTYTAQLQALLEQGIATFGVTVAARTRARIERTLEHHLANFPAAKKPGAALGLTVYPITKTPFVVLYDFDDTELRVHFIFHKHASLDDLDPASAEW